MPVGLRGSGRGHDPIRKRGIADRPLKRLLRAHRKSNDRAQVRDLKFLGKQTMDSFHIVADGRHRKPRPVQRFRRVARRGRISVSKQFCCDKKQF